MGRVFLGMSPGGRKVAIKVIHPECADSPQFRERFAREIDAARRVGGFHAAQVVDADPSADPPWMVTAYIEGPTLAEEIARRGPMTAERVRELGAQLAEGLAAIHAAGLVHRDLKPGNVILASDGPRIIDFGIARPALGAGLTTTGMVIGTIAYMSPEQARGETVGPASDVYSLGAVLAFCLTARSPLGTQPADLSAVDDEPLRDAITACLVASPALRPNVTAILAALAPEGSVVLADSVLAAESLPVPDGLGAGRASATTSPDLAPIVGLPRPEPVIPPGLVSPPSAVTSPSAVTPSGPGSPPGAVTWPLPDRRAVGDGPRLPSRRAVLFTGLGAAAVAAVGVPVGLALTSRSTGGGPSAAGSGTATSSGTPASTSGIANAQPVPNKKVILQSNLHAGARSVMFSPNGGVLASGNGDGTTTLYDVNTRSSMGTLNRGAGAAGQPVSGVAFSPDGMTLATASGDGTVSLWNVASRKHATTLRSSQPARSGSAAASVAFSPFGNILATSYDAATVSLWNVATGTIIGTLSGTARQWVYSLAFSSDGFLLATGSADSPGAVTGTPGVVEVWTVATHELFTTVTHTNTGPGALAFSGRKLANVNDDGTVSVRNLATQGKTTVFTNANSNAKSVAFRSDGKQLMTGNNDGTGTLWDTSSRRMTKTLDTGTKTEVPSVAYRRGQPGLACAGENLVLWTYEATS
jgi:hypothetical protein